MAAVRFDDLLAALQSELIIAQNVLCRRETAVRDGGRTEEGASLPSGGGYGACWIASLALSFECEMRRMFPFPLAGVRALVIRGDREDAPGRWRAERAGDLWRVRIVFDGRERAAGEVWLDDRPFVSVPARGDGPMFRSGRKSESGGADWTETHPLLWRLCRLLSRAAGFDGFVLTREQTALALAIARSVRVAAPSGNPPNATE